MKILFYTAAFLSIYSYFLYPVLLKLLPVRKSADDSVGEEVTEYLPNLSLIITAHNEGGRIREKLENTLQIDYPAELLEVIVASDFSCLRISTATS